MGETHTRFGNVTERRERGVNSCDTTQCYIQVAIIGQLAAVKMIASEEGGTWRVAWRVA